MKIKSIAIAAGIASAATVCEGVSKTASKATKSLRHNYWIERAHSMHQTIEDCPNCTTNRVLTGDYAHKVSDQYCPEHQPEAVKIIYGYANTY